MLETITVEKPFIRPNLTSNGVLGGDSFAVSCDSGSCIDGSTNVSVAYTACDGNNSTYFSMWATTASTVQSYYIYNPNPLRVKNIKIVNFYTNQYAIWRAIDGNFKGSNDGSNWEVISTFSNNNNATLTINGNLNKAYKYLAIEITKRTSVAESKMLGFNEIQIDATELITTIIRK